MIQLEDDYTEVQAEIKSKVRAMQDVILKFADDESKIVGAIARQTIFGGNGQPSLKVQSGKTQAEGLLQRRIKKMSSKSFMAGEAYWSHATNLHDNFKTRKKLGLLKRLKKEFSEDSTVKRIFENALSNFDQVK